MLLNSFHTWQQATGLAAAGSTVEGFPMLGSGMLYVCGFEASSTLEASAVMHFVQPHMLGFVGSPGLVKHRVVLHKRRSRSE